MWDADSPSPDVSGRPLRSDSEVKALNRDVCFAPIHSPAAQVRKVPLAAVSNRSTAASGLVSKHRQTRLSCRPVAALNQEQGARIANARVLTRRVSLHPVRLLPLALGQLLQNLLKHLGRVALTTRR